VNEAINASELMNSHYLANTHISAGETKTNKCVC